jgi:Sec-independent protein translocase protein TatA
MNDADVGKQIQQMVRFIRQEADEKASEISVSAEEVSSRFSPSHAISLQCVEASRSYSIRALLVFSPSDLPDALRDLEASRNSRCSLPSG